jgi:CRP-like cAMP-binding protein
MLQVASYETFQDGQIIFKEGDNGDWVYVIDSGSVELSKTIGGNKIVIEVLQEEEVFGEMAFIANIPRTATAAAIGKTTIGILDRTFLDEELNKLSGSFQAILRSLVLRLKKATDALTKSGTKS